MRRSAAPTLILVTATALLAGTGCRAGGIPLLNLLPIGKPIVVALVTEEPLKSATEILSYEELRKAMGKDIGRNVYSEPCLPFQAQANLKSGMYHVAVVSPVQYARFGGQERLPVLAVAADMSGRVARSALLVVAAASDIQSLEGLRGGTVAFGPSADSRTHHAALRLLEQHGVQKSDLSLEVLPIPGSLKHMPDMRAIAQSVINGSSDAGFLDEAAWEAFPEHDEREGEPARGKLRVIGKTVALPDRLVIRSPKLDQGTAAQVRDFLLAADQKHPEAVRALQLSSYQAPNEELLDACAGLVKSAESAEPTAEESTSG